MKIHYYREATEDLFTQDIDLEEIEPEDSLHICTSLYWKDDFVHIVNTHIHIYILNFILFKKRDGKILN